MAGKFWREHDGVKKMTVYFLGGKFSRRYIFFGGDVEPTPFFQSISTILL